MLVKSTNNKKIFSHICQSAGIKPATSCVSSLTHHTTEVIEITIAVYLSTSCSQEVYAIPTPAIDILSC